MSKTRTSTPDGVRVGWKRPPTEAALSLPDQGYDDDRNRAQAATDDKGSKPEITHAQSSTHFGDWRFSSAAMACNISYCVASPLKLREMLVSTEAILGDMPGTSACSRYCRDNFQHSFAENTDALRLVSLLYGRYLQSL